MAHLNYKGPDEKGSRTGRKLGLCKSKGGDLLFQNTNSLGKGLGKNKKNKDCKESGKRLRAGKHIS